MFDSGVSAKALIDGLKQEVDVAIPIADAEYISWLNSLHYLLYTEIIKEQAKAELTIGSGGDMQTEGTCECDVESESFRFEDIYTVYADVVIGDKNETVQLIKSTMTNGVIFPFTYYKSGRKLGYHIPVVPEKLTVIYFAKPDLITEENYDEACAAVPVEFLDLVKAKLRGEAYKLANEGSLAAVWINDYNVLLENFRVWVQNRTATLGM